jgi:hypothetical protein
MELKIFHDPQIYINPSKHYSLRSKWNGGDYNEIFVMEPDLIILGQRYINQYFDEDNFRGRYNEDRAAEISHLYSDAKNDEIIGYKSIFETDYAIVYEKVDSTEP